MNKLFNILLCVVIILGFIFILLNLISYHPFGIGSNTCSAYEETTREQIKDLSIALENYYSDYGKYPPDDRVHSSKPLVKYLSKEEKNGKTPYYLFNQRNLHKGKYYSPIDESNQNSKFEYHYRVKYKKSNGKKAIFVIWTSDCEGNKKGIKNR